ncbi:MAG: PAS domain S-box protein, partial [Desulfovibrionales bacterium]|nr:PAS domain S-box protein [Desulfovibrionales bacterium]
MVEKVRVRGFRFHIIALLTTLLLLLATSLFALETWQAEEDTDLSTEMVLKSILRSAPVGIGMVEKQVLQHVNGYILELTGYTDKELIGQNVSILYPTQEEFEYVEKEKNRQISQKGIGTVETSWLRKDGSIRHVLLSASPLDITDFSAGLILTVLDITDQQQSEERFAKAFGSSPAPLVISEISTGRFIEVNDRWVEMLGHSRAEQIGKTSKEIGIWSDPTDRDRIIDKLQEQGFFKDEPIRFKTKAGEDRYALWSAEVITLEGRSVLLSLIMDETDRKLAEAALSKRTGIFLFILSGMIVVLLGLIGKLIVNLQQRKAAVEELRKSERKTRAIMDQSFQFIGVVNLDGTLVDVNNTALEFASVSASAVLNKPFWETVWWSHSPELQERLRASIETATTGQTVRFEASHLSADGTPQYFDFSLRPVKDEAGNVVFIIPEGRDITERRHSEDALLQSELRARAQRKAIADLSLDRGVLEGELSAALERVTETVTQAMNIDRAGIWMLSDDRSELRCLSLYEVEADRHCSGMILKTTAFPRYFEAILSGSRICAHEAQADPRTSDLSEGYLVPLNITSMLDAGIQIDGRLAGVVCLEHVGEPRKWYSDEEAFASTVAALVAQIMANIRRRQAEEDREKLQSQLLQAQKMESVGLLAGGVAHDFNNLLQTMQSNIELLIKHQDLYGQSRKRIDSIVRSLDRAAKLVQQLLLFGRKAKSSKVKININSEVTEVSLILERTIPKMINLELYLDPEQPSVSGDPIQIEQVLLNLANNAADAMPQGGKLVMETKNVVLDDNFVRMHPGSTSGCYVLLTVSDTGIGIDPKTLEHIYDPFFTTKEVGKGTGLGLASVYGIVKEHGGYIKCYSEVNKGTAFKIY